jgi:hypothetical protein
MLNHKLRATLCTGLALLLLASAAHAATLTAKVDPATSGTTKSPQPHTTSLGLQGIYPGVGGNAKSALLTLVESMPADFAPTFSTFATCSPSVVVHGDNKPNCPAGTVLGHVSAAAYVPSLLFSTHSDQGYIFKIGENRVGVWVHVSHPIPAGVVTYGTVTSGTAPFGPVVTWDFKPLAFGAQTGAEVRINAVTFNWEQRTAVQSPTAAGASPSSSSRQARICQSKARRIKNKRKRAAALRRCSKPKVKVKHPPTTAPAPFVSTGCTNGRWPFRAEMTFFDKTTQTADAAVACAASAGGSVAPPSAPAPAPPASKGPLCPPLCVVTDAPGRMAR